MAGLLRIMAMTDAEYQALIQKECNVTGDATVTENLQVWWAMYAAQGQIAQYWQTRKHVLMYVQGQLRTQAVDTQNGTDVVKASQLFTHVSRMLQDTRDELKQLGITSDAGSFISVTPNSTMPDSFQETYDEAVRNGYWINGVRVW